MNAKTLSLILFMALLPACGGGADFVGVAKKPRDARDQSRFNDDALLAQEQTFKVATIGEGSAMITAQGTSTVGGILMLREEARSTTFHQVNREVKFAEFDQGHNGELFDESFELLEVGTLDLLLVIDNSQSMEEYQNELAERFQPLLEYIGNADWQIAVVTTDSPCRRALITVDDYIADPTLTYRRLADAIRQETTGSPIERGIEMAVKGLQGTCGGPWARDDSEKVVLILSNEENCGSAINEACEPRYRHYKPDDFFAAYPAGAKVFGILDDLNLCETGYDKEPLEYIELVQRSGGQYWPVCTDSYADVLTRLSEHIGKVQKTRFALAKHPAGEVELFFNDRKTPVPYEMDGRTIVLLEDAPADATSVKFVYHANPIPKFDTVQLTGLVDPSTIAITINETPLDPTLVQFDQVATELVFLSMPPDRAKVRVSYRLDGLLTESWPLPGEVEPSSLEVFADGRELQSETYSHTSDGIEFSTPPPDGSTVRIEYALTRDFTTDYQLTVDSIPPDAVSIWDPNSSEAIPFERVDSTTVRFARQDIIRNREVAVRMDFVDRDNLQVVLPYEPIPETYYIDDATLQNLCKVQLEARVARFQCQDALIPDGAEFRYSFIESRTNEFVMEILDEQAPLTVYVDGEEIQDYLRDGPKVTIPWELLTDDSIIVIRSN